MENGSRHIVIVCPGCGGTGAVGNVALHHAEELARYARVTLISDSFPETRLEGVGFHRLRPLRYDWLHRFAHVPNEVAFAYAAKAAIRRMAKEERLDLVLCHGHPAAALAARPLKRHLGLRYALVTHGDIFDRPKGTYDSRLTWFYRQVTGPAYRKADLVMALSPHMRSLAIRGGAVAGRVRVIPNGIDPIEIGLDGGGSPTPKEPSGRLELLYVGRLSVEKGVDILLEAVALLVRRRVSFRLRLVGSGPEEQRLRALAERYRLRSSVELVGSIPRKKLGKIYQSADLVCVPSRSDPLPTVVLEAMAAGVPVIGTDSGGIGFMIRHGETGWVVAPEDAEAIATAVENFLLHPDMLSQMGSAAHTLAVQEFSWQSIGIMLNRTINDYVCQILASEG